MADQGMGRCEITPPSGPLEHGNADLFATTGQCVAETSSFHDTAVIVLQKQHISRSCFGLRLCRPS